MNEDMDLENVEKVTRLYDYCTEEWEPARVRGLNNFKFVLGDQWTTSEKAYLLKTGRPPAVINIIRPRLNTLVGISQQNSRQIIFKPQHSKDKEVAQLLTDRYRKIYKTEKLEEKQEKAFISSLINPIPSFIEIMIGKNEFGELEYQFSNSNEFNIWVDPEYREYDMSDARWLIKERWMRVEEINDYYGVNVDEDLGEDTDVSFWEKLSSSISGWFNKSDVDNVWEEENDDLYKVLELNEKVMVKNAVIIDNETGEYYQVLKKDLKKLDFEYTVALEKEVERIKITTVLPAGNTTIYKEISELPTSMYNLIPYCGSDYNHKKSESATLVDLLIDPQKAYNKRNVQMMAYADKAISSVTLFSAQDKQAREEYDSMGGRPNGSLLINDRNFKAQQLAPSQIPPAIFTNMSISSDQIDALSNIPPVLQGLSEGSEETGVLYQAKSRTAVASLNPYFKNFTRSNMICAKYFLETVGYVYGDDDRVLSIINKDGDESEALVNITYSGSTLNSIRDFEGEVVTDEGINSPTALEQTQQMKMALLNMMPTELINWEWMLEDMNIPNIEKQIEYMNNALGIQAEQQSVDQEIERQNKVMDTATKANSLRPTGGDQ